MKIDRYSFSLHPDAPLYVLAIDHERVVAELRTEVEGLRKDAERWRAEMEFVAIPDKARGE